VAGQVLLFLLLKVHSFDFGLLLKSLKCPALRSRIPVPVLSQQLNVGVSPGVNCVNKDMISSPETVASRGVTLIELIIVMAVMAILLAMAIPSYRSYTLRVHRTEAIRLLLQASICQERVHASRGIYDTGMCLPVSEQQRYQVSYRTPDNQGQTYVAMATPTGAQRSDPCGGLTLDQNGVRSISVKNINNDNISTVKCWNGR
jgi:type IV pilus assembly protein PilE